ncbi:MAG: adenylate/guanylate cyclase domain-containing protein [Vicinamibacteria bacterium]
MKALISEGCAAEAFDLACDGLSMHKADITLEYLRALALDRGGNPRLASQYVAELLQRDLSGSLLIEALSLAGKAEKRKCQQAGDEQSRREAASASAIWYERAYQLTGDYFPGINAAAMSLLAGERSLAEQRARELLTAFAQTESGSDDFWLLATRGEAHLIVGNQSEALRWYRLAVERAADRMGDLGSMLFDLKMLGTQVSIGPEVLGLFNLGRVVAFAGHMVDKPGRVAPRFPAEDRLVARIREAIDEAILGLDARIGYSSVACGSDILFAKAMIARGRETHVVVPFALDDFYGTSVQYGQPNAKAWRADCDFVLANAHVHYATKEAFLNDDALWAFSNTFTQGLAISRASELGTDANALVLLDTNSPSLPGGTVSFVESWGARPVQIVDLASLRDGSQAPVVVAAPSPALPATRRQVKAMLFADVKNFSKLEEGKTDTFFSVFPHEVASLLKTSAATEFQNTWGDGLFLVFDRVKDCADFALRLVERMSTLDFEKVGLPADTTVRVGVHAGPVFSQHDPIISRVNFFGSHVNRAARIEPVTTPGCVFATEQFAGLLAVEGGSEFTTEYMGIKTLPKDFDRCALYRLGRRSQAGAQR